MKKEIFQWVMSFLDKLFLMSINKKEKETDYNNKLFTMIKEHDLPEPFKDLVIEGQLILVTGKNVTVNFAMKIQEFKNRLGGNVTDKQLYRITNFLKEDGEGKLYVSINKSQEIFIKSYVVFILGLMFLGVILFSYFADYINNLNGFLLYLLFLGIYFGGCFLFLNAMGSELTALAIKRKQNR